MKNKDYYNRPSLKTSYQIAVIAGIGMIIVVIGLGILEMIKRVSESM